MFRGERGITVGVVRVGWVGYNDDRRVCILVLCCLGCCVRCYWVYKIGILLRRNLRRLSTSGNRLLWFY